MRIHGRRAVLYAQRTGARLSHYATPLEEARAGLTVDEAREILREDPGLVYVDVPDSRYRVVPIPSADAHGMADAVLREEPVYVTDDRDDAEQAAIELAPEFGYGVCVLDVAARTVDWGDHTTEFKPA